MKLSTLIIVTLITGVISSLIALYIGYQIAQQKLAQTTAANPLLNFFAKL